MTEQVSLALPSKGTLSESTLNFLRTCDLRVHKANPRQYTASIPTLPHIDVLFQRVSDIVYKVAEGTVHMGITGLDIVQEHASDNVLVIHEDLGYGGCDLALAVPESWIDVDSVNDLIDISLEFREVKHRNLRIATKFTSLTRRFLNAQGLHHFTLVESEGALEVAPTLGYADIICDLVATGTTLRENHLKTLDDGVVLKSQSCLIANREAIDTIPAVKDSLRTLLELIDATMQGRDYYTITANIMGDSAEDVGSLVAANPLTRGLQGPTIAPIYAAHAASPEGKQWFTVTIMIESKNLLSTIQHLREVGGVQATVMPTRYVFMDHSPSYAKLEAILTNTR